MVFKTHELKQIDPTHLNQKLDEFKVDLARAEVSQNTMLVNLQKTIDMLQRTTEFTKGTLKYESNLLIRLLGAMYDLPVDYK